MTAPVSPGLPRPGDVVDGKYRIEREIGRGGMAVVFEATQLLARRAVAMKWLLPQVARSPVVVERFLREAQAAARIDHPSVVAVLDVGRWGGDGFYLVMELLVGENVRERLLREGTLPVSDALAIASTIVGGVHAAHRAGVVHRDIKPENVFLRRDERGRVRGVKLLDFGISKLSETESLTLTGAYVGTAHYLAPEQAAGEQTSNESIDVYQIGVLLYEMLSGRTPYDGPSYGAVVIAVMTSAPTPLRALRPDLPAELVAMVGSAMARDVRQRPASALALAELLRPFVQRLDEDLERALAERARTQPAFAAITMEPTQAPPTRTVERTRPMGSVDMEPSATLATAPFVSAPTSPRARGRSWAVALAALSVLVLGGLAWLAAGTGAAVTEDVPHDARREAAEDAGVRVVVVPALPTGIDPPRGSLLPDPPRVIVSPEAPHDAAPSATASQERRAPVAAPVVIRPVVAAPRGATPTPAHRRHRPRISADEF